MIKRKKSSDLSQNLSSNTLFHFTKSIAILKNILREGFRLTHVPEVIKKIREDELLYYVAPMVCFCDIPLGGVKVHLQRYGNYGLGIHKNFCKSTNINPVFYVYNHRAFNYIFPESMLSSSLIMPYVKRYHGENVKKEGIFRFYNEREWRYVTNREAAVLKGTKDQILKRCYELDQKLACYLKFRPNDIEYIIVENKSEITKIVDFIEECMEITKEEKKMLYTKIISANRIKNDF